MEEIKIARVAFPDGTGFPYKSEEHKNKIVAIFIRDDGWTCAAMNYSDIPGVKALWADTWEKIIIL